MKMRGIYSSVTDIRRKVFTEVARLAYEGGDYSRIDDLPYKIVPGKVAVYRESIFLERAIVEERLRLAIGLPLRPIDEHEAVSYGIEESAIAEKYYDPPLVNIINFACNACPETHYHVTDCCQGCLANPCKEVCPKGAIEIITENRSLIRVNVLNAEDVRAFAHIMLSIKWNVLVQKPAEWTLLVQTKTEKQKLIMINAFPAECVL